MPTALLLLATAALAAGRHTPHANINAVAAAPLPGGGYELVAVATLDVGFDMAIRSRDDGLTWEILTGDGLGSRRAIDVVFHPGMPGGSGPGQFLIATDTGVFAYDPAVGTARDWSQGLTGPDLLAVDLDAPLPGSDGPALLATGNGRIFRRYPGDPGWTLVLDSGLGAQAERTRVAVAPHFDSTGGTGPARAMLASVNKVLYLSQDGGASWTIHPRFNFPVGDTTGFEIRDLAFAEDYLASGVVLVAQGQESPAAGRILRSGDFGQTFAVTFTADTEMVALQTTPVGPDGKRHAYAAPLAYPWRHGTPGIGILRSDDGGLTWSDFGNAQDFILRREGVTGFAVPRLIHHLDFALSPDYATDGRVWASRDQGLIASDDQGEHWWWVRTRPEIDTRVLAPTRDLTGDKVIYSGHYGSGLYRLDLDTGRVADLNLGNHNPFVKTVVPSPNHDADGTLLLGVYEELMMWFDPRLPAANPYGVTGWLHPPLDNPSQPTGRGFPRTVAVSPHYDGTGTVPGGDLTFFYNAFGRPPERSEDAGQTAAFVPDIVGGGTADYMKAIAVAPTYDAANPAAHSDVYALRPSGELYRLQGDQWQLLTTLAGTGQRLVLDPAYSRPSNPRLFVLTRHPSVVYEIVDQPGNLQVTPWDAGLATVDATGLAVSPDLTALPWIYVSTIADGVLRLDLSAPNPTFQPVGSNFPPYWSKAIALSPDFPTDRILVAGTADGNYWMADTGAGSWQAIPVTVFRDVEHTLLTPFAPGDPANPDPTRMWLWPVVPHDRLPFSIEGRGEGIAWTRIDGSYWWTRELLRTLEVYTVAGKNMGTLKITLTHLKNGVVLTKTVDLARHGGTPRERTVRMRLPSVEPVEIRIEALLDPGEVLLVDGIGYQR